MRRHESTGIYVFHPDGRAAGIPFHPLVDAEGRSFDESHAFLVGFRETMIGASR